MNKWMVSGLLAGCVSLGGCADLYCLPTCTSQTRNSSSLVDFLYPDGAAPPISQPRPQLSIPLRVGLAFLPSANSQAGALDAAHKTQLLERVKQRLASRRFISEIVLIPDYYFAGQKGFTGLQAVQRLYGVDAIALMSFDQEMHIDNNDWSLAYMTVVGAYVVKGSRHDVSTLVDLAVIDPLTRQLVIRAGGTDLRHGNATLVDANRQVRDAELEGFSAATDQLINHFDASLTQFEADVRSGTAPIHIVSKNGAAISGGGGGGALDEPFIGLLLLAIVRRAVARS